MSFIAGRFELYHAMCMFLILLIPNTPCEAAEASQEAKSPGGRVHPFLFIKRDEFARTRAAATANPRISSLADALVQRARNTKQESLPPLETEWWQKMKSRPWSETYGPIWHHTGVIPLLWAGMAQDKARASAMTGDESLALQAKSILLNLADYSFEFEHYDVGMNYTLWCMGALDAYDITHDVFQPDEHRKMKEFFDRALAAIVKNDEYWIAHRPGGEINNHYAWHKLGRMMIGLFYERIDQVEQALRGPKGVLEMMRHGFKDDGLWIEASIPYQLAQTGPMVLMAQMLDNAEYPFRLSTYVNDDGLSLKGAYDALFETVFPDRTLPCVGDCYATRSHLGSCADCEWLFSRYRDVKYAWLISDHGRPNNSRRLPWESPENVLFTAEADLSCAAPPDMRTRLWPEHGYAALRTAEGKKYWSGDGWTVFCVYSDFNTHGNFDKLSIMLFGDNHLWLPRVEAATAEEQRFAATIQKELNRSIICQNALEVDGRDPAVTPVRLDLIEFASRPQAKRLVMGDLAGRLYPGVLQSRTLIARNDYVFDCYQVAAAKEHEYSWITHIDGKTTVCSAGQWRTHQLPAAAPWKYLRNPRQAQTDGQYWEVFENGGKLFRIDLACDGPIEVVACDFPLDDSDKPKTMPMRMIRARRPTAIFTALYQTIDNADADVEIKLDLDVLNTYQVHVAVDGITAVHRVAKLATPTTSNGGAGK